MSSAATDGLRGWNLPEPVEARRRRRELSWRPVSFNA
jgi:hypothetical protein